MNSKIKLALYSCLFVCCIAVLCKRGTCLVSILLTYMRISDLRAARWMLEHSPGDRAVSSHEDEAINEIDHAIEEFRKAAIDDGKSLHDHPNVDLPKEHSGRLHRAAERLRKVHQDTNQEEDDPSARGLKHRAIGHVDNALDATEHAIRDVEHHH